MRNKKSLITRAILFSLLLLSIETLENFFSLSQYFPRSKLMTLAVDHELLKILAVPALFMIAVLVLVYFAVIFYFLYVLSLFLEKSAWQKLKNKSSRRLFVSLNYFFLLDFIYSLNAFLFQDSAVNHFLLYSVAFPYRPYTWSVILLGLYFFALVFAVLWLACRGRLASPRQALLVFSLPFLFIALLFCEFFLAYPKTGQFNSPGNIIILGADSMQYNRLTKSWGYPIDLAPNIGGFLENSVCFTNAWTPFARTYPSYNAILTGRYPINNGIRDNLLPDKYINPANRYIGEVLGSHGYFSSHYTDEVRFSLIRPIHGFDRLFHPRFGAVNYFLGTFFDYSLLNLVLYTNTGSYILYPLAYNRAHVAYNPDVFVNRAIREINKLPRGKPQFIVIHLCANHYPYFSPYPYSRNPYLINFSERCIAMADRQVGEFLRFFKKSGLLKKSTVILLSDHGDGWSTGTEFVSHGSDFDYIWSNKMVLGFWWQGCAPKKIPDLVRSIDIYPTLLQLSGFETPADIDGVSMLGLMRGEKGPPRTFFAETGFNLTNKYINGKVFNLQTEVGKFMVDPKSGLVFEREEDYAGVLQRKWYMMISENSLLVYSPFFDELKFGYINTLEPGKFSGFQGKMPGDHTRMLEELKKFNRLQ